MKILYITFIDFGQGESGSSVRPEKMYNALLGTGHEIILLEGQQNQREKRRKRVAEILDLLKTTRPDICYVEPPSGPFFNRIDLTLLKKIHSMNIPVGLFYRDAYWKLADWWGVKGMKRIILTAMHVRDLRCFKKYCSLIYFPSKTMADLFDFPAKDTLPPAAKKMEDTHAKLYKNAIYVGGFTEAYGSDILLEAFDKINSAETKITLTLVCRSEDIANLPENYKKASWLTVMHASGEELLPLYRSADVGIIPNRKDKYMDMAISVKLFEYLSHGLPVVVTHCKELAAFVKKYSCGLVCEDTPLGLAEAVEEIYSHEGLADTLRQGVKKAVDENEWKDRADKVIKQLSEMRKDK